jgi:antitoxin (DNA-binding transcriptional repressor) of toxin-antitoxin stability system
MTIEVEATETTMSALLESIERGDQVRLLKHGRPVALVQPQRTKEQIELALEGMASATERAKRLGLKFDIDDFKADREFGRR